MSGQAWVDQRYLKALLKTDAALEEDYRRPKLSERERAVLGGVLEGLHRPLPTAFQA